MQAHSEDPQRVGLINHLHRDRGALQEFAVARRPSWGSAAVEESVLAESRWLGCLKPSNPLPFGKPTNNWAKIDVRSPVLPSVFSVAASESVSDEGEVLELGFVAELLALSEVLVVPFVAVAPAVCDCDCADEAVLD